MDRESLWSALPTFVDHGAEEEKLADVMDGWLLNEGMPEVIIRFVFFEEEEFYK